MTTIKFRNTVLKKSESINGTDAWVVVLPAPAKSTDKAAKPKTFSAPENLPASMRKFLDAFAARTDFKAKPNQTMSCDVSADLRAVAGFLPENIEESIRVLKFFRNCVDSIKCVEPKNIVVDLRNVSDIASVLAKQFAAALTASLHVDPKFVKEPDTKKKTSPTVTFVTATEEKTILKSAQHGLDTTISTNLVRTLAKLPPNELDCAKYVERCRATSKEHGLKCTVFNVEQLRKMKAGAFLSVARASSDESAAIVKIEYTPKTAAKDAKHLAVVGKGIVFDTGGLNLKPAAYMIGMHGDMAGSAVALSLVTLAARAEWPIKVTAYMAIAQNDIGPNAFRQNEVVTALNGKTIEIMHTDAEGRMVLSDTLTLASRDKPDLMLDFATLTGACVGALGEKYSGAFSNRPDWRETIIRSGVQSGERVWPFPMDADFGEVLKSDIADTKQCRLKGGPDHIEAAMFLQMFIENDVPWIHIDLSACENDGGLAHVPDRTTGFGARIGEQLARNILNF